MIFDTLTIVGILTALLSGGFLIALVSRDDVGVRYTDRIDDDPSFSRAEPQF
ncbi:MAG: hypothetical protein H6R22_1156 [Chromatiaceae bacterium]|nr:hypothetical protein [Chromatiaceae bacterium]